MAYGIVLENINTDKANEIIESGNIGIVICKSSLSDEVKDIFNKSEITVYENITDDKIEEVRKKLRKTPEFINADNVIPGGKGESYQLVAPPLYRRSNYGMMMVEYYQRIFETGSSVITTDFESSPCILQLTIIKDRLKEKIERAEKYLL